MNACLVLAAICGPGAAPPAPVQVTVELRLTSVDDGEAKLLEQSLRRELSDRLLQDGFRVVPGGQAASVAVWVHLGPEGARVQTRGVQERVETIAAGDPEVVALEVLQLTTALVEEVRPMESVDRPAVALDVDGQASDPQLRERLQVGLLERGYALTRTPTATDQRLCVSAAGDDPSVHVTAGDRTCEPGAGASRVAAAETVELRRVLLLDGATAALDQHAQGVVPPEPPPPAEAPAEAPAPSPEPAFALAPSTSRAPEPVERRTVSVTLTAQGGLVGRSGGPDGAFGVGLRAGRRRGLGGGLELTVVPSAGEGLRVVESMPTGRLDWRIALGQRGLVGLAAFGGLHVHHFRQHGPTGARGVRLAPSLGTTVRLAFLGSRGLMAFGGLRAGWSGGRWIHVLDGTPTWERSSLLVGLELGAGWDFPWRRTTT